MIPTGFNSDQSQREAQALFVQKLDIIVHWINRMVGEMAQNSETSQNTLHTIVSHRPR